LSYNASVVKFTAQSIVWCFVIIMKIIFL
jgi:hypothetical protein